jgi:cytochrome c oxidase cbb3-type subunit I/II
LTINGCFFDSKENAGYGDIGVPYTESQIASGLDDLRKQAVAIEENLKNDPDFVKVTITKEKSRSQRREICSNERKRNCLIAYMQRLGTDIKVKII